MSLSQSVSHTFLGTQIPKFGGLGLEGFRVWGLGFQVWGFKVLSLGVLGLGISGLGISGLGGFRFWGFQD